MLRELKRIIDDAFRKGLSEALGGRHRADHDTSDAERTGKGFRAMPTPEEQAARAAMRRISFN
jgi:hypothetical protein